MKMFKELGKIIYIFIKPQHLNVPLLKDAFSIYSDSEYSKYNMIFEDELVLKGTNIIGVTKDKDLNMMRITKYIE